MYGDSTRHKLFSRRAAMLAGGKALLLTMLAARMYYLQVVEADHYKTLADENRINLRLLPPPRGRIVDRFGMPMAVNKPNYRVVVTPEDADDVEATLESLGRIISISDGERRRFLREIKRKRRFVPVTVRENLAWNEVARIEVNLPDLPGVDINVGQTRDYPFGQELAHVLGYVAAVSESETTGEPLLELPGFRIGKAGIEKLHDAELRGTGGSAKVEVNAVGRVIKDIERKEGLPGAEVGLSIDVELQRLVVERLGEESASAVLLDIHTGEILAMASTPSFNPNAFNEGLSSAQWRDLTSNPKSPLINKAIAGQYAPGSTFKMAVAMAALERGAITPQTEVYCAGHTRLGDAKFHCWKRGGHGALDLHGAITHSCDVFFYEAARRTGVERIATMARRLGLGQILGIDLPGEQPGLMPSNDWKLATIGTPWQMGETLIAGIGQGYILVTPLQLAIMTARIANGGFAVKPRLTRYVASRSLQDMSAQDSQLGSLGLSAAHVAAVREGMISVVNASNGTAHRARIVEEGMEMAGKTGTVQVRRISKAERDTGVRKNEDLPWKDRDHALFVGFAPVDRPKYAVAVVVEHGGGGSKVAAPIARDVLLAAQLREKANPQPYDPANPRPDASLAPSPEAGDAGPKQG